MFQKYILVRHLSYCLKTRLDCHAIVYRTQFEPAMHGNNFPKPSSWFSIQSSVPVAPAFRQQGGWAGGGAQLGRPTCSQVEPPWLVGTLRVPSGITWPGTLLLPALGTGHLAGAVWSGGTSGLPPSGAGQRPARAPPGTPLPLTKTQHQPHRASHRKHMPAVNKLISGKYSLFNREIYYGHYTLMVLWILTSNWRLFGSLDLKSFVSSVPIPHSSDKQVR